MQLLLKVLLILPVGGSRPEDEARLLTVSVAGHQQPLQLGRNRAKASPRRDIPVAPALSSVTIEKELQAVASQQSSGNGEAGALDASPPPAAFLDATVAQSVASETDDVNVVDDVASEADAPPVLKGDVTHASVGPHNRLAKKGGGAEDEDGGGEEERRHGEGGKEEEEGGALADNLDALAALVEEVHDLTKAEKEEEAERLERVLPDGGVVEELLPPPKKRYFWSPSIWTIGIALVIIFAILFTLERLAARGYEWPCALGRWSFGPCVETRRIEYKPM